jgi:hypothetical protein
VLHDSNATSYASRSVGTERNSSISYLLRGVECTAGVGRLLLTSHNVPASVVQSF